MADPPKGLDVGDARDAQKRMLVLGQWPGGAQRLWHKEHPLPRQLAYRLALLGCGAGGGAAGRARKLLLLLLLDEYPPRPRARDPRGPPSKARDLRRGPDPWTRIQDRLPEVGETLLPEILRNRPIRTP